MNVLLPLLVLAQAPADLPDGTLLFLEGSKRAVEEYTESAISHVAVVLNVDAAPFVYEAEPPRVRRVELATYYDEISQLNQSRGEAERIRILVARPKTKYAADELTAMRDFLNGQLGRRYSIRNYVRSKPGDGIHCAELTSRTLNGTGRFRIEKPYRQHPGDVMSQVRARHWITMIEPNQIVESPTWGARTKGWFDWCRWSSWECWTFCW